MIIHEEKAKIYLSCVTINSGPPPSTKSPSLPAKFPEILTCPTSSEIGQQKQKCPPAPTLAASPAKNPNLSFPTLSNIALNAKPAATALASAKPTIGKSTRRPAEKSPPSDPLPQQLAVPASVVPPRPIGLLIGLPTELTAMPLPDSAPAVEVEQ